MLNKIKGIISKDPIVSLNVIPFLVLFTIPFPPSVFFWPGPLILALEPFLTQIKPIASMEEYFVVSHFPSAILAFRIGHRSVCWQTI